MPKILGMTTPLIVLYIVFAALIAGIAIMDYIEIYLRTFKRR